MRQKRYKCPRGYPPPSCRAEKLVGANSQGQGRGSLQAPKVPTSLRSTNFNVYADEGNDEQKRASEATVVF